MAVNTHVLSSFHLVVEDVSAFVLDVFLAINHIYINRTKLSGSEIYFQHNQEI